MADKRSICVYAASSAAAAERHLAVADRLGALIAQAGYELVYGGGSTGLMGAVARAVHAGGGRVVGVIPESMKTAEVAYMAADELIVTDTMRQRKQIMDDRADAFVTLPGGFGTLEELLEITTLRYLKFHAKPIVIVNAYDFYRPLRELFEHLYAEQFARPRYRDSYQFVDSAEDAMAALRTLDGDDLQS